MTELQEAPDSTVIDTDIDGVKSGGGKVAPEPVDKPEPQRKNESVRDSLEAEAKRISAQKPEDDEDNDDDKPVVEKKETAKEVKPAEAKESEAKAKDETEQVAKTPKPSEGRKIIEAPARLLPQNKELWKGVAHPIREEWVRREQEYEREIETHRQAKASWDDLREFDDMARQSGTTLKQAMSNYVGMENAFRSDPAQGFRALMSNLQMQPQQAISHILRAYGVSPQQLVQHMSANPNDYTSLARQPVQHQQPQAQQQQANPEIQELRKQLDEMRATQLADQIIAPFAKEYPEYYENENQIAEVLKSGIIERIHGNGLSPRDKLEAALLMVAPHVARASRQSGEADSVRSQSENTAPVGDLRGDKSVKSSPGGVTETTESERKLSMRDMLEEEARKLSRRAS
jgi:hypothetical protein